MKKVIFLIVFALIMSVGFAGPFGLEMGMTLEEIKEKCGWSNVVHISDDMYDIKPPKPSFFLSTLMLHLLMILLAYTALVDWERPCLMEIV